MLAKTAHLIYNPHAGYGTAELWIMRAADSWRRRGWRVDLRPTQHAEHATALARAAADAGVRLVFAAGGDGTLNEVANGLVHTDTIMAPLPVGTANSFAKELNMPLPDRLNPGRLIQAADALAAGRVQRMDIGFCAPDRYWLLWASAGADSYVVDHIEPRTWLFKQFGPAGYAVKGFSLLPTFPGMKATVTIDDQTIFDEFVTITISNCRLFGGGELRLNPYARLDDGEFEVWLLRGRNWADALQHLWKVTLEIHIDDPNITVIRGRQVTVESEPIMPYQVDGEPIGETPLTCTIQPSALRLLVPNTAPRSLFTQPGEVL